MVKCPVKTIVFSANVAHGVELCEAFNAAGYDFRQISYLQKDDGEKKRNIQLFREGKVHGLVSCEALVRGFDVPDILCLISARPYRKSFAAHIQQLGRVMRAAPNKEFGLVLDHSGNVSGWREETIDFFENGVDQLPVKYQKKPIRKEGEKRQPAVCHECGAVGALRRNERGGHCEECGYKWRVKSQVTIAPGVMSTVSLTGDGLPRDIDWMSRTDWMWDQMCGVAIRWTKGDVARASRLAFANYRSLYDRVPNRAFVYNVPYPDRRVQNLMSKLYQTYKKASR